MSSNRDLGKLTPIPSVAGQFVWNQATTSWQQVTKAMVALGSVDNTADNAKPVSAPQQTALDLKLNAANPDASGNSFLRSYGTTANSVSTIEKNRGTPSAPTGALNNDRIGAFAFQTMADDGTTYANVVLEAFTTEAQTATGKGALFQFAAVKTGSTTRSVALQINGLGQISMPNGYFANQPGRPAQYTLTTLPSASAYTGYEIDVTNATGGSKRCRSSGTVWQILNTTTTVS